MSLSIPSAPNSGLFKQGYQKYILYRMQHMQTTNNLTATNPKTAP